jgi:hypothetical protein
VTARDAVANRRREMVYRNIGRNTATPVTSASSAEVRLGTR